MEFRESPRWSLYRGQVARKPRLIVPGGIYHVTSKGNNDGALFWDATDRRTYLDLLAGVARAGGWRVLAYCQMTNHVHLVVRVPSANLSDGMQRLNTRYSRATNRRHARTRHLFQNRFDARHVADDAHLWEVCRYDVLNPVRAGICSRPELWEWSSYRASVGLDGAPAFLAVDELWGIYGSTGEVGRRAFAAFVEEALPQTVSDTEGRHVHADTPARDTTNRAA